MPLLLGEQHPSAPKTWTPLCPSRPLRGQILPFLPQDVSLSSSLGPAPRQHLRQIASGLGPCLWPCPSPRSCKMFFVKHHSSHPCLLHKVLSCHLRVHKVVSKFQGVKCPSAQCPSVPNTIYPPVTLSSLSISKLLSLSLLWASACALPLSVSHESLRLPAVLYPQHVEHGSD